MASMYDPATRANISVTGNLLTSMYVLIFFISNAHLALFNVVIQSFQVIPLGVGQVSNQVAVYFIELDVIYFSFMLSNCRCRSS